jgi:hypothetical protein
MVVVAVTSSIEPQNYSSSYQSLVVRKRGGSKIISHIEWASYNIQDLQGSITSLHHEQVVLALQILFIQ